MDNADKDMGYFKNAKCAEYIFNLCDALKLPVEARYLAIEIYDRFMIKHIRSLYQFIQTSTAVDKLKDWNEVEARIKVQMPLRLLSCVQLASKLSSHRKQWGKTKILKVNADNSHHIKLEEQVLEEVEASTYLGSVVNRQGGTDADVRARFGKALAGVHRIVVEVCEVMVKHLWQDYVPSYFPLTE
ncbi:Hypothetical predicted protein [Paramuricea clavata]|uniref:Uncharacterized protein n=1 Tax=Paramuricea clavata TaxID=317549 RepID=A0A6S7IRT4_PARCT|nr:Hypothetical predicted protein [Paramuricea clavata]